jgi:chaperonin GroES
MKIKPLSNRLLVEVVEEEQKTESGILLPDTAEKTKNFQGKVTAVGSGKLNDKGERIPMSVKVGDNILFKKPWSEDEKLEDKYYLIEEDDVLGIID